MASSYDEVLGLKSSHKVPVSLSISGVTEWTISKAPAMLGGQFADWVYTWANKKWPNYKRGAKFVGGVGVLVAAYGLQLAVTKYRAVASHLADKITDGMIGRISPVLWDLLKGLLPHDEAPAARPADPKQIAAGQKAANGVASLDGDRDAVMQVGQLLHQSPETTDEMASHMLAIMKRDKVEMNPEAEAALVRSMREVSGRIARGQF